ncbi:hypothetical protein MGA3_08115 [Bacillus methanolicus MGA3]|uniref:YodN n=2 Tax=Bacillus methanolicus TaxID=1471 RepID=I3E9K0_BACMM|nr:hypothetical protein BMMGA3_10115 [Bacillus methanolicus MGA3]EIJ83171.1 hypothetical protein MGA3_08115 [Bacillus methanolicus MGA3]
MFLIISDLLKFAYTILMNHSRRIIERMEEMDKQKKPKYKIGDTVVITMYGTVGKVTDVKYLSGVYVYEINNSEGLYMESSLQLISEYEGELDEKEQIDIEYMYFFGDLVHVTGYGADLFKVVGFRTEIWRYKDNAWEDVIYELSRVSDGEWLEAGEEELTLVADADSADKFIEKLGLLSYVNNPHEPPALKETETKNWFRKAEKELLKRKYERKELIDSLLDIYNDYRHLYEMFHDKEYEKAMRVVIRKLRMIVNNDGKSSN